MNTLVVKFQLLLLGFIVAMTTTLIIGMNLGKDLTSEIDLNPNFSAVLNPVNWQLENKKTIARLHNQNLFQASFMPKQLDSKQSDQIAGSIPILLYHGVTEKPDGENVTVDQFRDQLVTLKKAGYETISLEQFKKFNNGEIQLPEKSFMITFDDGRKDSFYMTDPILEALNYTAVTFIITDHSIGVEKSTYYLNEKELKIMQKTGRWEIESHSKNAHDLVKIAEDGTLGSFYGNKLWLEEAKRLETDEEFRTRIKIDLITSKQELENSLGKNVSAIALPFGDYGQHSKNFSDAQKIVKDEASKVYELIMYQTWADNYFSESVFNYQDKDNNMIKRIDVKSDWNYIKLFEVLSSYQERVLPFSDNFEKDSGWVKNWGEMSLDNKSLFLGSNDKAQGSLIFLSGGLNWVNYSYRAYIDWLGGEDAALVARFKDSDNFVSCRIGDGQVSIAQRINGVDEILETKKEEFVLQLYGASLEMIVQNNTVSCLVEGKEIAKTDKLSPLLNSGSIGFSSWDRSSNNSAILIKYVSVEEIR
jgi:peptidoglycan/xylan/chitin deacetylase (PgdA/CDA1 family)